MPSRTRCPVSTTPTAPPKFAAVVADDALSKHTDVDLEADKTTLCKKLVFANGETSGAGYMVGIRHRF